jgi:UDP-N-acetylmuramoyl-tripeptide--D-alanyl-D-alanine ligase
VGSGELQLSVPGRHQVANAAAVVTAAVGTGLALDPVLDALSQATITSRHRMAVQERADGVVVVDDAYNANPESVRAALDAVSILGRGRRRWAVLGEMLELGPESARMHAEVGAAVAASGVDELVGVGTVEPLVDAAAAAAGWAGRARLVADDRAASRLLEAEVRPGDVVLVKGSNSLRLWRIAERLLATPSPAGAGR